MMDPHNIPNLDGLMTLANRDGVDIKPTLLRVMTDLYVQKPRHTAEEEQHYTELALRLIDAVDAPTRAVVSSKLAAYAAPPASIMQRLRRAEAATATTRPPRHTGAATTANELCELFLGADPQERRLILINLRYASLTPAEPIPPTAARSAVQRLEAAALNHNSATFTHEFETVLGLSRGCAQRMIADPSGETIVVAARALAMPADVLQRILLCLNPTISQSVLRVYELARLYEDIEPRSALRMLAIWRAAQMLPSEQPVPTPSFTRRAPPQAGTHQPQFQQTRDRPAALPARPEIRWEQHAQMRRAENQ